MMSTETSTPTLPGFYNDNTSIVVLVVIIILLFIVIFINVFALVSILRYCYVSIVTFLICYLSIVEVFQIATCGTTTIYSFYNTQHSYDNNAMLCTFYAWLYVIFRIKATLLVSILVLDRVILSLYPKFYVRLWILRGTRWILGSLVLTIALVLASLPLGKSQYIPSPDGRRFYCFYKYSGGFAVFYVIFHVVQTLWAILAMPWVISREDRVDATLSVLLVGDMVVYKKGRNIVRVRDRLKISRLVSAVAVVYHACSLPLPILLFLRFLDISYPAMAGLIALQLPTFGALFFPLIYGLLWKPFRRAYYNSLSCLCPASNDLQTRPMRSMINPAFCETREYETNSILHSTGVSLTPADQDSSSQPSTQSQRLQLDPNLLENSAKRSTDDSLRPPHEHRPSSASFHERHLMPSKFQNIFEIVDALSGPNRASVDTDSECSSKWTTPRNSLDSVSSISNAGNSVNLKDVALSMPENSNAFRGVDFSSVHLSRSPYSSKKVDKIKLNNERSNSFKETQPTTVENDKKGESSSLSGQIRFTDLRKVRTEKRPESFSCDSPFGNQQRFRKYFPEENT